MKRTFAACIVVLAGIFVFLSLMDISDYALEKKLWHLQNKFVRLNLDPGVVPEKQFEDLAGQYTRLLEEYPFSKFAGRILVRRGKVDFANKNFDRARESFQAVLEKYPSDHELAAEALFHIGLTYEAQDDFPKAQGIYQSIIEKYPLTEIGITIPLYMANYYLKTDLVEASQEAFERAITFYTDVHNRYPGTSTGYMALRLLATAYLARQDWDDSMGVLEKLLMEYPLTERPNDPQGVLLVKTINIVALNQLRDLKQAERIYQAFIGQYPRHPLTPMLKGQIREIQSMSVRQREGAEK